MKSFSLKFLDIMIGIVLGLGFQWWPSLKEPWQFLAFVFVYLDVVDYWIDYGPSLKKFPPKREIDVMLDVAIMFSLFLYIYATQLTPVHFFASFVVFRVLDFFWLLSSKYEYHPTGTDKSFIDSWLTFNLVESFVAVTLIALTTFTELSSLVLISTFIVFRIFIRVIATWRYKKVHFT
ncbi:MAG: hypothetical protein V4467_03805 [Patescibacteria group bacterium]